MRIGIISDTHLGGDGRALPQEVLRAFQGVDLILHCGDLDSSTGVLDYLETVAPVKAVRGYPDPHEDGDRLAESTRVVEAAGLRIGMIHDIAWPGPPIRFTTELEFPPGDLHELMRHKFGQPVDIVAFGDTHEEHVSWYQGVLFVNPGSPTVPGARHRWGDLGTVALLDIHDGVVTAQIVRLQP